MSPTSFFNKNIGAISGRVLQLNKLCNDLAPKLDFTRPDYENAEIIKEEAFKRNINLTTTKALKLLCRIKRKQAGWKMVIEG